MVKNELVNFFGNDALEGVTHGGRGWYNDQHLASVKIQQWEQYPSAAQFEHFHGIRIDRGGWPGSITDVNGVRDSHLLHNAHNEDGVWDRLLPLLRLLVAEEDVNIAVRYREEFKEQLLNYKS